jgi:hypothetical protein
MKDDITKRYPRTMHEAFNCDCDPISGPYGKPWVPLVPIGVIIFVIIFVAVLLVWGRV